MFTKRNGALWSPKIISLQQQEKIELMNAPAHVQYRVVCSIVLDGIIPC